MVLKMAGWDGWIRQEKDGKLMDWRARGWDRRWMRR